MERLPCRTNSGRNDRIIPEQQTHSRGERSQDRFGGMRRPAPVGVVSSGAVIHWDVKSDNTFIFIHGIEGVAGRATVTLLDVGLAGEPSLRARVAMGSPDMWRQNNS
jgi:hypothetical protein